MKNIDKAKLMLSEGGYTLAAVSRSDTYTSTRRGVKPLLDLIDTGRSLEGYSVADRVVGRAAAFLYVLLKADEVYANIMSRPALEVFEAFGLPAECGETVDAIINRTGTGLCPMESSVIGIDDPCEAEAAIRKKLAELKD